MKDNEIMNRLIRPQKLNKGDNVATVSPALGIAGDSDVLWRYNLGKKRLEYVHGIVVIPAPNSMKGSCLMPVHCLVRILLKKY